MEEKNSNICWKAFERFCQEFDYAKSNLQTNRLRLFSMTSRSVELFENLQSNEPIMDVEQLNFELLTGVEYCKIMISLADDWKRFSASDGHETTTIKHQRELSGSQ